MAVEAFVLLIAALVRSNLIEDAVALIRNGFADELSPLQREGIIHAQNKLAERVANS